MTDMIEKVSRVIDPEAWQQLHPAMDARAANVMLTRRITANDKAKRIITALKTEEKP